MKEGQIKVSKERFDAVLAKMLKAPPIPLRSLSPKKRKRG